MTSSRRETLRHLAGVMAGVVVAPTLLACGDDDDTNTPPGDAGPGLTCASPGVVIQSNHGHSLAVSMADVDAGAAKTYDIMGTSGHTHEVTISASGFSTLKSTGSLMVTSTSGSSHTHLVTVTCTT